MIEIPGQGAVVKKALILRGSSVQNVIHHLSICHERFERAHNGDGSRIAQDHIVTYDDVYNVYYQIKVAESRKDEDPIISSNKWMAELKTQEYFTSFDEQGVYKASRHRGRWNLSSPLAMCFALMAGFIILSRVWSSFTAVAKRLQPYLDL
ncbi:hypothetical protein BGZ58_002245 [Dissophora ornata]|nr:hypothetical protein BGZ58_002245 [Dissophora ornata]